MKYLFTLIIGISLGFLIYPKVTFIKQNCDTTKYSDQWESLSNFETFECLNTNIKANIEKRPKYIFQLNKLAWGSLEGIKLSLLGK